MYVVGVDSARSPRAVIVSRGRRTTVLGTATHEYPNGVIDRQLPASGEELPPSWALQDPADWLAAL